TEAGPEGLLTGKRAVVALASGGTQMGSEVDFATGYLRFVLSFIGITDVEFVAADRMAVDPQGAVKAAEAAVDRLAA
ncbi:NAD(P)H-dependent oxidoreductase, partial [Cribrihabitans sp. XS_ASV171]